MTGKKPVIGISFFVHDKAMPIWCNGATQNCIFLTQLFRAAGYDVVALNGGPGVKPGPEVMLDQIGLGDLQFVPIREGIDRVDVLIECGAQVYAEHVAHVRNKGGKAVAYKFGNSYVLDAQRAISERESGAFWNGAQFDAVWTNAQHINTCAAYWQTLHRCRVECLPHIWEPWFVDAAVREFGDELTWGYKPGKFKKSIAVFEPNIDIVKTAYFPMLVCEESYRAHPERFAEVYITNAITLMKQPSFISFASALDIVRHKVCTFEARFNTPYFVAKYADVVVSHQWENALNYAYYDVLHGGYPFVHNSPMLPDGVGYRYDAFNCQEGGRLLSRVLAEHDKNHEAYTARAQAYLATVKATAPANIKAHESALQRLLEN